MSPGAMVSRVVSRALVMVDFAMVEGCVDDGRGVGAIGGGGEGRRSGFKRRERRRRPWVSVDPRSGWEAAKRRVLELGPLRCEAGNEGGWDMIKIDCGGTRSVSRGAIEEA